MLITKFDLPPTTETLCVVVVRASVHLEHSPVFTQTIYNIVKHLMAA